MLKDHYQFHIQALDDALREIKLKTSTEIE